VPKKVETNHEGRVTILWNQQVDSDRNIPNNELDIIIRENEKGTCLLIHVILNTWYAARTFLAEQSKR
jgi:hypothetical protein